MLAHADPHTAPPPPSAPALSLLGENNMTGTLPAEMSAFKHLTDLDVWKNDLRGLLPALDFGSISSCFLLAPAAGGTNAFLCPFPPGAVGKCKKEGSAGWVNITAADCHSAT